MRIKGCQFNFSRLLCTITILLSACLCLWACGSDDLSANDRKERDVKYTQWWQEVKGFTDKGLPRSALEVVEKIYASAKKQNHRDQLIKALIHKADIIQKVEEDPIAKIHALLLKELKESAFPVPQILHSMLADQYWNYFKSNRYRILRRSDTANIDQKDIRTWNLRKIVEQTVHHYRESLKYPEKLKKVNPDLFDEIIIKSYATRLYRPTLYDFLAHRAINFFADSHSGLTQPIYRFSLNNPVYFADSKTFSNLNITTRDPLSFHYYALTLLQDLTRFHLEDGNLDALVDLELKRLRFLYNEAVVIEKESIYEKALLRLLEIKTKSKITAEVYYRLASLYEDLGDKYKPGIPATGESYKWYKKKAHERCVEGQKNSPALWEPSNATV